MFLSWSYLMFILVLFRCNDRWLNCSGTTTSSILDVIPAIVQVNHVIWTNRNLVHPIWFTRTVPGICMFNVSMRHVLGLALFDVHFASVSLQRPMIKLLWNYKFLNFGCDPGMVQVVQVSLVIYTNTNLVHSTWLTFTILGVCLSNV